jgi:hypothetical protein
MEDYIGIIVNVQEGSSFFRKINSVDRTRSEGCSMFQDNEMFKKIQRHRYMNIIRSIQLEKSIKIKHYTRMEEKLNLKMERLTKVCDINRENGKHLIQNLNS